jgi:predicted Zn-dependent protease
MRVIVLMMLVVLPALAEWAASYRLGEALLQQGRTEDAVRELKIALEERPEEVAILDALGRRARARGNLGAFFNGNDAVVAT